VDPLRIRDIAFTVSGYPPAKNEAKSMLAAGHMYAERVLALLRAAQPLVADSDGPLFADQSLGLELVLFGPAPPPSDATNYLGGVADVLEAKAQRGCSTISARLRRWSCTRTMARSRKCIAGSSVGRRRATRRSAA
jgi:hypothetical protein